MGAASGIAAVAAALLAVQPAAAQAPDRGRPTTDAWHPVVLSYFLRRAGDEVLNPFAATGRREVIQLLIDGGPLHGRFRRVRLDRMGDANGGRTDGWYQIDGAVIRLYYGSPDGTGGRIETGRYLHDRICLTDPADGRILSYEYLPAAAPDAPAPPASPGAPEEGSCAPPGRPRT